MKTKKVSRQDTKTQLESEQRKCIFLFNKVQETISNCFTQKSQQEKSIIGNEKYNTYNEYIRYNNGKRRINGQLPRK